VRKSLGWFVKASDGNLQGDLVQVRNVLEPEIAAIAAQMASADDIANLQHAVNSMDASLEDAEAFIEADQGFHLALANATHNKLIPTLIDPIVDLLREQRKRIFLVDGGAQRGQFHHKRILNAIQSHDPEAARTAMQAHLAQVAEDSDAAPSVDQ
jgi:GntR family transcriptional repressor for pyruvate dehydrogenase complex